MLMNYECDGGSRLGTVWWNVTGMFRQAGWALQAVPLLLPHVYIWRVSEDEEIN